MMILYLLAAQHKIYHVATNIFYGASWSNVLRTGAARLTNQLTFYCYMALGKITLSRQ
jgi:hypothetical protein